MLIMRVNCSTRPLQSSDILIFSFVLVACCLKVKTTLLPQLYQNDLQNILVILIFSALGKRNKPI